MRSRFLLDFSVKTAILLPPRPLKEAKINEVKEAKKFLRKEVAVDRNGDWPIAGVVVLAGLWVLFEWARGSMNTTSYVLCQTAVFFFFFILSHEAVHGMLGQQAGRDRKRIALLNQVIGSVSLAWVATSYDLRKEIHMSHHLWTCEPKDEEEDGYRTWAGWQRLPEYIAGNVSGLFMAVFWMPIVGAVLKRRGWKQQVLLIALVDLAFATAPEAAFFGWFLPAFLAGSLFWFGAVFMPHGVFGINKEYSNRGLPEWVVAALTSCHVVHHLDVRYPWYQYPVIWYRLRKESQARGWKWQNIHS